MNNKLIMIKNALLVGAALSLTACGGSGGPALVSTPPPIAAPTPAPTPAPNPVTETKILTTDLTVWTNGVDYYQDGDYITFANNWGAKKLNLPKSEYSQKVEIHPATFPNKTLITWKYPDKPYGEGNIVYGFPSISWGKTTLPLSGYNTAGTAGKVGDVAEFKMAYDITLTGDPKYMNLMHDVWLWDPGTGKIAAEILLSVKPSDHTLYWANPNGPFGQKPGAHNFQFTQNGVTYNMLVFPFDQDSLVEFIPGAKNVLIMPIDGSQQTSGTVDWMQILNILLESKDIDPSWLIKSVDTGVEVQAGSGSMLVNAYSVTFKLKDQKVQAMVAVVADSSALTTTTASQINATTMQQILNAAVANPKPTTYAFGSGNIGMGTNFPISDKISLGTSNVFYTGNVRGYTMASNMSWRNKNSYAIMIAGAGKLLINNTDINNTFVALETGTRIPGRLLSFSPYTRLSHTHLRSLPNQTANSPAVDSITLNSVKLSGGMNTDIPLSENLLLRVSGEVSNEFLGRTQATARLNSVSSNALINVSGVEYVGSATLSTKLTGSIYTQVEVGTKKNRNGKNSYANVGMKVPF